MAEATKIDGVNLTSVTVNAASPDVIGALMKQITEATLKAIPEGTIEKIAKETIDSGKIVYQQKRNQWNSPDTVEYILSNDAKEQMTVLLRAKIVQRVQEYFADKEVIALLEEAVLVGIAAAIDDAPRHAAHLVAQRLAGAMCGDSMDPVRQIPFMKDTLESLRRTQTALVCKRVIDGNQGVDV